MPKTRETPEQRAERREACKALRVHPNTHYVRCVVHGGRGHVVDVWSGNLAEFEAGGGLCCDPTHPGCFDYFEPSGTRADAGEAAR